MKRNLTKNPISFERTDGGRAEAFPEAFKKIKRASDCVVRAIAIATGVNYKSVWIDLHSEAISKGFHHNNENITTPYLESKGFKEVKFSGKEVVRINDERVTNLCKDDYAVIYIAGHYVAMKDNTIYDTFNSSTNTMSNYSRVFRVYAKK